MFQYALSLVEYCNNQMQIERYKLYPKGSDQKDLNINYTIVDGHKPLESSQDTVSPKSASEFQQIVLLDFICDRKSMYSEIIKTNVNLKLTSQAIGSTPIPCITKIKLYANKHFKVCLKIQTETEEHLYYVEKNHIFTLFQKVLWLKLATMNIFVNETLCQMPQMQQQVLAKMDFLGQWHKNILKFSKQRTLQLFSKQKHETVMKVDHLNQFWTRLQTTNHETYLIVKIWVGFFKYSVGIPINDKTMQWMRIFSELIAKG